MASLEPSSPAPESLAAVFTVAAECQRRIERSALAVNPHSDTAPGMFVSVDDLTGVPELSMVKLLQFATDDDDQEHDLYVALRLQAPDDGWYRVAAAVLVDLAHAVGDRPAGEHTIFSDERDATTVSGAVAAMRELTDALCSTVDDPASLLDRDASGLARTG